MALDTFDGLCAEIADYTARVDLTTQIPMFVRLAEVKFARMLRTVEMETTATLTTASNGTVALPADFQEIRGLTTGGFSGADLDYLPPETVAVRNGAGWSGDAYGYTMTGTTLTILPLGATALTLVYSAKFVPLGPSNESNWLLANHPDAYLYGTLAEYGLFNDPAQVPTWQAMTQSTLTDIAEADRRKRWGSGRVVLQGCAP